MGSSMAKLLPSVMGSKILWRIYKNKASQNHWNFIFLTATKKTLIFDVIVICLQD